MATQAARFPGLPIDSLAELEQHEAEIVRRINEAPNGGRLFIADPLRLLEDISVSLSPVARRELEERLGADELASNPLKGVYDDFRRDAPSPSVKVVIRGIMPKGEDKHA